MAEPTPLLEMRGIRKSFSGTEVLHGVDLTLGAGEVLALLGENGAGKSTLIKILNGDYAKDAGQIVLDGKPEAFRTPRDAQRAGIRVVYQELNDAPALSAAENVLLGQLPRRSCAFSGRFIVNWAEARRRAGEVLSGLNADFPPDRPVRRLSVGQRQVVEIAKALSATTPARVLVMDEPTAALTPREVEVLFDTIGSLRRQGVGIIYISHRLEEVRRVAQRVMVLRDGNVAGVVGAADVTRRDIVRMMVGRDVDDDPKFALTDEASTRGDERAVLKVEHLSRAGAFTDVSFAIRPGEIVGMFGLLGAGHLSVTRSIFGVEPADRGRITVNGVEARIGSPRQAKQHRIGLLSEDRKTEGLVPAMSVADNVAIAHWRGVSSSAGVLQRDAQALRAWHWVEQLGVRLKGGIRQPIATLSGGNQQKVLLARWLEASVRVLLLNEPTRGVDVGARGDIYSLLNELRTKGLAVIVSSSDLEEVRNVSDRVLVFAKGRLVAEFDRQQASQETLLGAASQ